MSTEDDPAESIHDFGTLWQVLDQAAKAHGLTRRQWADKATRLARAEFSDGSTQTDDITVEAFSSKTLFDRIRNGRRADWDNVSWFVKAIPDLDIEKWRAAWARAEQHGRTVRKELVPPVLKDVDPVNEFDPFLSAEVVVQARQDVVSRRWWRRSRILACVGVVVVAVVISAIWLWPNYNDLEAGAFGCARVSVEKADVFRNPDGRESMTVKIRGELIRLPRELKEVTGSDGRRYRMVRTPTRTSSGYAYMLAATLTMVEC